MNKFIITTDAACDLDKEYLTNNNIHMLPIYYSFDEIIYGDEENMTPKVFYDKLRDGILPVTMAVNPSVARTMFEGLINEGYSILHIGFSSGLSGSYNVAAITARDICEENPQAKITVIDSLSASLGQGLLVHKAIELKKQGKSMDEVAEWVENNKLNLCHIFTVADLSHLHRGGRISKTTALVGSLINIKPVLHVDDEGLLIPLDKVRGRKKSLMALVKIMEEALTNYTGTNDTVFISHGDSLEDAEALAGLVKEKFNIDNIYINYISPIIGSHSGPGTLALFFMGSKR